MRVFVGGSRNFTDSEEAYKMFLSFLKDKNALNDSVTVISGGAMGADTIGEELANRCNLKFELYLPDWESHGNMAGFARNKTMAETVDEAIIFWNGKSSGTKHMVNELRMNGIVPNIHIF